MTARPLVTLAALALAGAAAVPAPAAPLVEQLVVFRDGASTQRVVSSAATRVRTEGRRCRVPGATPLAALARSEPPGLLLRDFSDSCDPSSLFVERIRRDRNRGQRGWVYKVGNRQGTTAASDPSGPFGSGRISRRTRVTWFYCVFARGGCQRTLGLRASDEGEGMVSVRVTGYDDEGRGKPVAGALVSAGRATATTDRQGLAALRLAPGVRSLRAVRRGFVRSFDEKVTVR